MARACCRRSQLPCRVLAVISIGTIALSLILGTSGDESVESSIRHPDAVPIGHTRKNVSGVGNDASQRPSGEHSAQHNSGTKSISGWCGAKPFMGLRCPDGMTITATSTASDGMTITATSAAPRRGFAALPNTAHPWLAPQDVEEFSGAVRKLHARFAAAKPPGVVPVHETSEPAMDPLMAWFVSDIAVCVWGGCAPIDEGEDALWAAVKQSLPPGRRAVILATKEEHVREFFEQHWPAIRRAGLPVVLLTSQVRG